MIPAGKLAILAAMDERGRRGLAVLLTVCFAPFALIIVPLLCIMSGAADHNRQAVDMIFNGTGLLTGVPESYQREIRNMQRAMGYLDDVISEINAMAEGEKLDSYEVKAVFYSLFFGADSGMKPGMWRAFADCFVEYEEREDDEGETYTVAIVIKDQAKVYANIASSVGKLVTDEDKTNAMRIYSLARYGENLPVGSGFLSGAAMGDGSFSALMTEATRYIGYPYVWGGSSPATSFDCSGYICWVYTQSGVHSLPRTTAQGIFNQCAVVPREEARPGDLIFFTGTYAASTPVSHVGIYVGNGQMLHCGSPIGYADINSAYWMRHFYAFGRLPGGDGVQICK